MTFFQNYAGHLEKLHSNVRQKLGRQPEDDMLEIDVNMMLWRMLMSAHLGQDYHEILRTTKNTDFDKSKQLFDISQKLMKGQSQDI